MYPYIEKATKNLTVDELSRFALKFRKEKKSEKVAYMWWAIFGIFGGHRFYLGNYGTGLIILAVTVFTLGLGAIVGLLDIKQIPRLTQQANEETVLRLVKDVKRK